MTKCQSFVAGILFVVIGVDGFLKRPAKISRFFCDDEQKGIILMKNMDRPRKNEHFFGDDGQNKRKYYDQTISRQSSHRAEGGRDTDSVRTVYS